MFMNPGLLIPLFAAVLLLAPWQQQWQQRGRSGILLVDCQGLAVTPDSLGAGQLAVVNEFNIFEDALELAAELSGGRGRGGRGGTGRLGAGGITTVKDMQQLQLASYAVAASPKVWLPRKLPPVRDQGACSTCVGEAVATAVQMAIASALNEDAVNWDIDARSLYYCSLKGRTCKTGWDIPDAFKFIIDQAPELMRPAKCLPSPSRDQEPDVTDWGPYCEAAKKLAASGNCTNTNDKITREKPLLKCSYRSLSNFYQMQQHIRNHGAIVSRIIMNDDWEVQFNETAKEVSGLDWPAYKQNITAKPSYGHAVALVGYNNDNFRWIGVNSWGNFSNKDRLQGVTKDGLFRINMGLAGVGTPEQTYGVSCTVFPGNKRDLHGTPWLAKARKLVSPVSAAAALDINATCYRYTTTRDKESVSSIVESFDLDYRDFIQLNRNRLGSLQEVTYKIGQRKKEAELQRILEVVGSVTRSLTADKPYLTCTFFDNTGVASNVTCRAGATGECAKNGTVECTLRYKDVNVTETLPKGTSLQVCDNRFADPGELDKVAIIANNRLAQQRALVSVLRSVAPVLPNNLIRKYSTCKPTPTVQPLVIQQKEFKVRWYVNCTTSPYAITILSFRIDIAGTNSSTLEGSLPTLNETLMYPILSLRSTLEALDMVVYGGTVPSQLGALNNLRKLLVYYFCMQGGLPPNMLYGLQGTSELTIREYAGAEQYQPGGVQCGITGPMPPEWYTATIDASGANLLPGPSLNTMDISGNKLSGSLPEINIWKNMQLLFLSNNRFDGGVPSSWADIGRQVTTVALENNNLRGVFPREWSKLRGKIITLTLDNNPGLTGCAPLDSSTTVTYVNTGMSGVCKADTKEVEAQQVQAVQAHLVPLLGAGASQNFIDVLDQLVNELEKLGGVIKPGQTNSQFYGQLNTDGPTAIDVTIGVELFQGATCITSIEVNGGGVAGLNLTRLVPLAQSLPRLASFVCIQCNANAEPLAGPLDLQLPSQLAQAAPLMKQLDLTGCGLKGSLPRSWGTWASLEALTLPSVIDIYDYSETAPNDLTGSIPSSYANLGNLKFLALSGNPLTGTLPPEFGSAGKMPIEAVFYLDYTNLQGPIPLSWSYFSLGLVEVGSTNIDITCIPDGLLVLQNYVKTDAKSCSGTSPQVGALLTLQRMFEKAGVTSPGMASWNGADFGGAGPKTPPKYCRLWVGVTCDSAYQVTGLNLTALNLQLPPSATLNLTTLVEQLQPLSSTLFMLDAATLQLVGALPTKLATFSRLELLNLSGNKGITGSLPTIWAALTAMRTMDISGTGISGSLPSSWASLQKLQTFKAVGCNGLSGQLPLEWGILGRLEELVITNSQLGGRLPAWTDATLMRAAGSAALAAAQRVADEAGGADLSPATVERQSAGVRYTRGRIGPKALAAAANRAVTALRSAMAAIPAGTRFMPLRVINLSNNKLSGQLVPGWSLFEQLQVLILSGNSLLGPLPDAYTRLTTLAALDLSNNSITGVLPSTWVSMRQLVFLDVSSNALVSPLPETLSYMSGEGFSLKCLVLADNAGMAKSELTNLKNDMETASRKRTMVVVARGGAGCNISVLDA